MNREKRILIQAAIIFIGIVFILKLFQIQVKSANYQEAANTNIIQRVVEYPYRGLIKDRHGEIIVHNSPIYDIVVVPKEVEINDTTRFCELLGLTKEELTERLQKARKYSSVKPSVFMKQVSNEEFARIQDDIIDFKGFAIIPRMKRSYRTPVLANVLGYIGEISKGQLEKDTTGYYHQGDYVGISGMEASYELALRGERGEQLKLVNARGIVKGSYQDGEFDTEPQAGENLISTIDLELQSYAEKLLQGKVGSIVAIEPASGEILTIASAPTYNPNILTGRQFGQHFQELQQDTLVPLFNRPIMADVYPPGSIFKLLQTLIALQEGVVNPGTYYACNQNLIGCHYHGPGETLMGAIRNSCNPYFYNVFRTIINIGDEESPYINARAGLENWRNYLLEFGLGRRLGIDIPNEKPGIIPSVELYDRIYGKNRWKFSNIYSLAIGQGELGVSPLQMANLVTIIANRGFYYSPHLVKSIGDNGRPLLQYRDKHVVSVDPQHFDLVVDAMEEVIQSGTGQYRAKLRDIAVCGKTGTVENPHGEDHSVFISFAPKEDPKIALSVYVENAGQGARAAAAISGLLIEKYLKGDDARLYFEEYVMKGDFLD